MPFGASCGPLSALLIELLVFGIVLGCTAQQRDPRLEERVAAQQTQIAQQQAQVAALQATVAASQPRVPTPAGSNLENSPLAAGKR